MTPDERDSRRPRGGESPARVDTSGASSTGREAEPLLSRRTCLATLAATTAGVASGPSNAAAQAASDVEPSDKRGYVGGGPAGANALGAGWFYDYMPTSDSLDEFETATYLPMINGDDLGWTSGASDRILESDYEETHVLGYNEPEHEEGYTDVQTILYPYWETFSSKFRDTDVAICSPSIKTGTSTGRAYLDDFVSAVESDDALVVDELAVHWYAGTEAMRDDPETQAQWFLDEMESLHQTYGRPIWITEFGGPNFANVDADALARSNIVFLQNTVEELERRDYIQGYAWWEGGRATSLTEEVDGELQLTDVGRAFVGLDTSEPGRVTDPPSSETVSPGRYQFVSVGSGHVLEVADGDEADGADVQQGADDDAAHQQWDLEYEGDGRYVLLAAHSGSAADVADATDEAGANVQQWSRNDGDHQRWYLDPLEGDQYRVVASHSDLVLDVQDGATDAGTSVIQYDWNGGDNQRWTLDPVETATACGGTQGAESTTVDGQTVCNVTDDGYYRDVNGDGSVGQGDVAEFFTKQHRSAWKQPDLFDFSGNDAVTHGDVVELFDYVALN